jgi:anion-transporting  ArsA/GET3 family ATPase
VTRVAVCCGVGGTGKTTTAAALALAYAAAGERVVVLTIDPARRLADALGVGELSNTPRLVPLENQAGTLHALMLDRKGTWDEVIRRYASADLAERLLDNRYYKAVSTRLSGSHEYMAVEKLHELTSAGQFDRVVLDTPPTQHVVDFFRAPDRIRGILDRSMLSLILDDTGVRGMATRGALSLIGRLAGERVVSDIREFFELLHELSAGFRERSERVSALLRAPATHYWLVANADAPERNDLIGFLNELRERGMTFAGFLINRVQPTPTGPFPSDEALQQAGAGEPGWEQVSAALSALPAAADARARAHRDAVRQLVLAAGGSPAWLVPEIAGGVRSLDGLRELTRHLPPHAAPFRSA